ncbi:MAG: YgiQ family radical SAM protein [Clostridia bacterium]|nr:YgiQ family radical SAM protein [Clostridia bacterium]
METAVDRMSGEDLLPMSTEDLDALGWDRPDITLVTGDAYVDHPTFGVALLGRLLQARGYRVAVIAQPDWRSREAFEAMPPPALFFGVSAGNVDSMVANRTPTGRRRRIDAYSPGGTAGRRPDRAVIVYSNRLRECFPGVPIVIGGLEASLRRFAHYDYWDGAVRRSILLDSKADLLVYGMGERAACEIADRLSGGERNLQGISGTAAVSREIPEPGLGETDADGRGPRTAWLEIPSFEEVIADKPTFARAFDMIRAEMAKPHPRGIIQRHGDRVVIQNSPSASLTTPEMDSIYELPFTRRWSRVYDDAGGVPALEEVLFSITSHRGCLGGCSFCAIWAHQGGAIQRRSVESLVREARRLASDPRFRGVIHDVGGPTANFYAAGCARGERCGVRECLFPEPCPNLLRDHTEYIRALRKIRAVPGVRKVFVRSGVRYDYAMLDDSGGFLPELVAHHVSGQLKVAPEHVSDRVLALMRKPGCDVYEAFTEEYKRLNRVKGKDQYLVPYFISGHPGSTLADAVALADYILSLGYTPEQVQDFTPTPMTEATCMYYTGLDPRTGKAVHVATGREKAMQRALLQPAKAENRELVAEAFAAVGRPFPTALGSREAPRASRTRAPKSRVPGKPQQSALRHGARLAERADARSGERGRDGRGVNPRSSREERGERHANGSGPRRRSRKS